MKSAAKFLAVGALSLLSAVAAQAQVVQYIGYDMGSNGMSTNGNASRASFLSATGGSTQVDFESALPAGFSMSGASVTSVSGCGVNLCGGNTTSGGSLFALIYGGTATFSFSSGVNYFGANLGGLQVVGSTVSFFDGSSQSFAYPVDYNTGGFAFVGFTDFNQSISSVSINVLNDIVTVDDISYGSTTSTVTPEPSTWAMMLVGMGALGVASRRRRKV